MARLSKAQHQVFRRLVKVAFLTWDGFATKGHFLRNKDKYMRNTPKRLFCTESNPPHLISLPRSAFRFPVPVHGGGLGQEVQAPPGVLCNVSPLGTPTLCV